MSGSDGPTDIHSKFVSYLMQQRRITEEESQRKVAFAESSLPGFIRRHLDKSYGGLQENTDHNYYRRMREEVFSHDQASKENDESGGLYTVSLGLCADFFSSRAFKGKPKVTLTENEKADRKKSKPAAQTALADPLLPSADDEQELLEGAVRQVNVTRHERNKALRQLCLSHYGYKCQVCGMDFEEQYGEIGKQYIEVHHLNPIAETDGEHALDPRTGLVPLCCNCHAMIHRGGKDGMPMTLEELREIWKRH